MVTADELLAGARYRDVDVQACTATTLTALVDGERVEVDLGATPALARDVQAVYAPGVGRLRIAQADLASVRADELDPDATEAWMVVADPAPGAPFDPEIARTLSPFAASLASLSVRSRTGYAAGLTAEEIAMWPNLCAIIDEAVHDGGQSSSRNGATVSAFQVHHSTMTSAAAYIRLVQQLLRQVSSNLAIDVDGRIIRVVNLQRRAWTSGSATFDAAAITVETANATLAPDYRLSEPAKAALGRVAAAIKADRAIQALTASHVYLHREMLPRWGVSYATACPMDITAADIIARANATPSPAPAHTYGGLMDLVQTTDNRIFLIGPGVFRYIDDIDAVYGVQASIRKLGGDPKPQRIGPKRAKGMERALTGTNVYFKD